MHSMSNESYNKEFYNYISEKIINYFLLNEKPIQNGSRFCLKLDTQEMVDDLDEHLSRMINEKYSHIKGDFGYKHPRTGEEVYSTYTLKANGVEIAIVPKKENMKEDFLATLRNTKQTMIMITAAPIDSISKGTADFSAKGYPFNKDVISNEIKKYIENSRLSLGEKEVLKFELERRKNDIFSDKSSLFEYKGLLGITNSDTIKAENFSSFRLLYDDHLEVMDNESEKNIRERISDNHKWYERIDKAVRFGSVADEFSNELDQKFIKELESHQNEINGWDAGINYQELKKSEKKKEEIKNEPLTVEDIKVYSSNHEEYVFNENYEYFIRNDGDTATKQRKKNILIFNKEKVEDIKLDFLFNRKAQDIKIDPTDMFRSEGKKIVLNIKRELGNCTFHNLKITDTHNSAVKFEFRICIIDISSDYFTDLATSYTISAKRKPSLRVIGANNHIIINRGKPDSVTESIIAGGTYNCSYDKSLILNFDNEAFSDNSDIDIELAVGGIRIPITIMDEIKQKKSISGLSVFKNKHQKKQSFKLLPENTITISGDEYYAKDAFRGNLEIEQEFINNKCHYVEVLESGEVLCKTLDIPVEVLCTYERLMAYYKSKGLVPSLTYYTEDLFKLYENYIKAVGDYFKTIKSGDPLTDINKNILKLGTVIHNDGEKEICFTPFHPMVAAYQVRLYEEEQIGKVNDNLLRRLACSNLLPYIQNEEKNLYRVIEQSHSPEWIYFAPDYNKRYKGARAFVKKLIAEKIEEYVEHFSWLFREINNKTFRINLINMGDCKEVFLGIMRYYSNALKSNPEPDELEEFVINIYESDNEKNSFSNLSDFQKLKNFINDSDVKFDDNYNDSSVANILTRKINCFFYTNAFDYEYAHVTFFELDSKADIGTAKMADIKSGVMLDGIISGIPSVFYGKQYRTGYGVKYGKRTPILSLAEKYNALHRVANNGNPYEENMALSSELNKLSKDKMDKIYDSSGWVTFIDPKVDLNFFKDQENKDLLIIHYSDQYTSSSGYDAITVTRKSKQYQNIIKEYLSSRNITTGEKEICGLIDIFNAFNGDWLLHLISERGQFSREKMSILSAIKVILAYYYHPDIIWIPISLEELLRVSGGTGLSSSQGILSAKNLGFETGKMTDDIMLIGVEERDGKLRVYKHPVEVKIGDTDALLSKAKEQVTKTAVEFSKILDLGEKYNLLQNKLIRNFIMQIAVISAEKLKLYGIWDEQNWDKVLNEYRERLLNDEFEFFNCTENHMGVGSIIAFNKNAVNSSVKFDANIEIVEIPEQTGNEWLVKPISEVKMIIDRESGVYNHVIQSSNDERENAPEIFAEESAENENLKFRDESHGIKILFGKELSNGNDIIWEPGNTSKVYHSNTGIIGTMGTGKTQFTQSVITQLYRNQNSNVNFEKIGILIFDYKGDYNESKADFVNLTNAKILKPYHLPYNPLSILASDTKKPLLPIHIANSFKDTISKIYGLGAKQENVLFNCIKEAYSKKGIIPNSESTWSLEAPTFDDVYKIYYDDDDIKKTDSLAAALTKLAEFEIFEKDASKTLPLFDLLDRVVVVDLSTYDPDIQNLVIAITLDLFYSQMQASGSSKLNGDFRQITKMILVDEADNFLCGDFASLKKILKEGREFGVGTILSTQFLKHFMTSDEDYSKYILTWVVHKVSDLKVSDIRFVFNTEVGSIQEKQLFNDVKNLEKHCSIVKLGKDTKPYYVKDKPFWELSEEIKK